MILQLDLKDMVKVGSIKRDFISEANASVRLVECVKSEDGKAKYEKPKVLA